MAPSTSPLPSLDAPPSLDSQAAGQADLLRRLAHEVRGPTGVTSQALRELELALAAGRPTGVLVAMMQRSLKRFIRLADRLSMAAELERGSPRFECGKVDLREPTRAATAEAMSLLSRRGVELVLELGDDPAHVHADTHWLSVALVEICVNAIRFANKAVVARITTSHTEAEVVVQDDGPGFGDVSPLERATSHASGLGLSLRMARDIVAAHQGRLTFGRTAGGGTGAVVTITLPIVLATTATTGPGLAPR